MQVKFTNLDKIYYPQVRITKGDIIDYYRSIAKYILPHLKDRPVTLKRYPDGIGGFKIYQRHFNKNSRFKNQNVKVKIYVADKKRAKDFIICNDSETLLYLAQLGTVEFHPWYSTVNPKYPDKTSLSNKFTSKTSLKKSVLNYPTFAVFDIDPPEGQFKGAVSAALGTKKILDKLHLKSVVKTSGKKGLHVFVPIKRQYTYDQVRAFAYGIGEQLVKRNSNITMEARIKNRGNKIFFDCNQNAVSKSLVSVYSLRATPQATVSFPVEWSKLNKIKPTDFTLKNVPQTLSKKGDIWGSLIAKSRNAKLP